MGTDCRSRVILSFGQLNPPRQVGAIVVANKEVDLETIRKDLRLKLAIYKVPRALRVYPAIPRNAMGKIAKKVRSRISPYSKHTEQIAITGIGQGSFRSCIDKYYIYIYLPWGCRAFSTNIAGQHSQTVPNKC